MDKEHYLPISGNADSAWPALNGTEVTSASHPAVTASQVAQLVLQFF